MTKEQIFAFIVLPIVIVVLGYLAVLWHEHSNRRDRG